MIFRGSAVALVTPFYKNGQVNYYELKKLIEFQIASGTKAIVILGTTGESATINGFERTKIIRFCVGQISGRIPLIVGTGSNSTETAKRQTKEAEQLGADAVLIVTPYYNKTSQEGLFLHYKQIAKHTKLPIIIYNVPSRTGLSISTDTIIKLSKIKNIVGLKDASGNLTQTIQLLPQVKKGFAIYSGDDLLCFAMMCLGAVGVISVTANAYPNLVATMCNDILEKNYQNALRIHNHLTKISTNLFLEVNPICIKFYMNKLGINVGEPRLPLTLPSKENQKKLIETIKDYET